MKRAAAALLVTLSLLVGSGGPVHATEAPAPARSEVVSVVSANIKSVPLMPQVAVRADVARMATSGQTRAASAYFGAEIANARYKRAWRNALRGYRNACLGTENPVAIARGWKILHKRRVFMHYGMAHVSPNRYGTLVKAISPAGFKVAFFATHMVSQAWKHGYVDHRAWRQAMWRKHAAKMRRIIRRLHAHGFTIFVGGDLNRPHTVRWNKHQKALFNKGLMQLAVVPASDVRVKKLATRSISTSVLHTDHPVVEKRVRLIRK